MDTQDIYIGFSAPNKFKIGAEAIKIWQGGTQYCHVYMKIYSNYTGLWLIYQASHGMVNCIEHTNFMGSNKILAEVPMKVQKTRVQSTLTLAQRLLGIPYGYMGLIKLFIARVIEYVFRVNWAKNWGDGLKTLHCSEFIFALFPDLAVKCGTENKDRIEPVHLYKALQSMGLIQ